MGKPLAGDVVVLPFPQTDLQPSHFVNELGITRIRPNVRGSAGYAKTLTALPGSWLCCTSHA